MTGCNLARWAVAVVLPVWVMTGCHLARWAVARIDENARILAVNATIRRFCC